MLLRAAPRSVDLSILAPASTADNRTITHSAANSPRPLLASAHGACSHPARKRPSCPRAPSDGLSSPIGEVGSAERPVRHQPPPAAAAAVPLEAGSHPSQLRQAMSASKSPADVHLDVAPTPKAAAAAPPAPSPARPLWHSLPASSRALLVLGAGSALAAGVFAATQFSRVRHTKRCELQTLL